MTIPENILRENVLKAIEEIREKDIPKNRKIQTWVLVYNNQVYPPKYVISLSNKYANGKFLNSSEFNTYEAMAYLRKLGFQISRITVEETGESTNETETENSSQGGTIKLPIPSEFDEKMYCIFKKFSTLVEERFKVITEGHSELKEPYQESEDTIRYMMFHALTTAEEISPLNVYLEYPHPEVPNKDYAKLDTFVAPMRNRPSLAFEMKFQKKIGNNDIPKPNNAGAVFADIFKLALFRKGSGNIKRYFVYVADNHMIKYLCNPKYEPFIRLQENMGFKIASEYLNKKPKTFIKQLKKIVEKEDFPEPTVVCRFRKDLNIENKEIAIRIYEVIS